YSVFDSVTRSFVRTTTRPAPASPTAARSPAMPLPTTIKSACSLIEFPLVGAQASLPAWLHQRATRLPSLPVLENRDDLFVASPFSVRQGGSTGVVFDAGVRSGVEENLHHFDLVVVGG